MGIGMSILGVLEITVVETTAIQHVVLHEAHTARM